VVKDILDKICKRVCDESASGAKLFKEIVQVDSKHIMAGY
jgi:hypothetical protein